MGGHGFGRWRLDRLTYPIPRQVGDEAQGMKPRADVSSMRIVLEWLGIVEPDRSRKEPVALPAWAPVVVPIAGALIAGAALACLTMLLRVLTS